MPENTTHILDKSNEMEFINSKINKFSKIRSRFSPSFLQLIVDIFAITLGYGFHFLIRYKTGIFETKIEPDVSLTITTGFVLLIYWIIVFWMSGLYKNWYIRSPFDELFTVIKSIFFGSFLIFFFVWLDSIQSPRMLFVLYFIITTFSVAVGRFSARVVQKKLRQKRIVILPSVILGNVKKSLELNEQLELSPSWGYKAFGFIHIDEDKDLKEIISDENYSLPVLGNIDQLKQIIQEYRPREVLIAAKTHDHQQLLNIATLCHEHNVNVKIIPDIYEVFTGLSRTLPLWGSPLIDINTTLLKPWEEFVKRTLDIVVSSVVLILGLPLWITIGVLVRLDSNGPVFYTQVRTGKKGKEFRIFKFRTMVTDADKGGPNWCKPNDPRVTKFGRFLRKSHLDEVPQFWNVLKGEMSLVGPRPEQPYFVEKFKKIAPYYSRRLIVRPGITGWWQIKYEIETMEEIENRIKHDFYYIENMSLKLDLEIMIRTFFLLFRSHGVA
jgi:exopolysaccharide biosynthesis polyprenyl glycosylphosphotransferase